MDLEIKHGFHRSSDPSRRISLISLARAPSQVFWALPYLYPSLDVVGSFVPATAATVGLVDRLLVYNHTYPSGTGSPFPGRSSFQDDLLQISTLMRSATSTSLLLIDEFGRGTRAADGAGLLGAVVQALAATGSAPRTLVCTHFSELFDPRVLPPNPQIACYTMATMVREDDTGVVGGGTAVGATGLQGSTAGGGGADATDTGVFFRRSAPHPIITTTQTDLATPTTTSSPAVTPQTTPTTPTTPRVTAAVISIYIIVVIVVTRGRRVRMPLRSPPVSFACSRSPKVDPRARLDCGWPGPAESHLSS